MSVRGIAAIALGLWLLAAPASAHTRLGGYQDMAEKLPDDWESPYEIRRGVPIVDYGSFRAYNPVTIAQYGLAHWSLWVRSGDRERVRKAMRAARWLRANQRRDGTWGYDFDYRVPGTTGTLPAGWASGLAQGQVISLLRRAHHRRPGAGYLRAARRALTSLRTPVKNGGLARWYRGRMWYEEYPLATARTFVLNGMQQALLGLYDLADRSPTASRLYRRGIGSLAALLPLFDTPTGWSYYSLVGLFGYAPLLAPVDYHIAHARLLRQLDGLTPRRVFIRYARRWESTV